MHKHWRGSSIRIAVTHVSGLKGEAGGMRSALEDGLAGWAQFRLPARRMNSARKSLPLAAVQILTIAPPASLPPTLLIYPIRFLFISTNDSEESQGESDGQYTRSTSMFRARLDSVYLIRLVYT